MWVGGSTKIPKIQQLIKDYFDGKELYNLTNQDEVIIYGAVIQASILFNESFVRNDILWLDVAPISLGIPCAGGVMNVNKLNLIFIIIMNSILAQIFSTIFYTKLLTSSLLY